jgi:hypothetical protein
MSDRTCTAEDCERTGRLRRGLCDMHYQRQRYANGIRHVSNRKCSVEGCDAPHKTGGLCGMHYWRLRQTGDAGEAGKRRLPSPDQCTVDGCSNTRHLTKGLCRKHYSRLARHGDVEANPFKPRGRCAVLGCGRPHEAQGYCSKHYWMWRQHGDPEPGGYQYAHYKVRRLRGSVRNHPCRHCGDPAREWAYDHADPRERNDPRRGGPYSLDPDHYIPLCVSCHRRFDWKMNGARMGSYLGRDAILAAASLKTEDVSVPEWGGSVLVRELRGRERDDWEASLAVQRGRTMVPDVANMRAKLVALSVIGEDGESLFTRTDVAALGELSAAALDRVFEVASRLSGLNPADVEEMAKNSGTAPSGGSTSGLPGMSSTTP